MNDISHINRIICSDKYFIIMNGILSLNETFLLLPNQSLSMEYKQLSCVSNIKLQLIIHFIITRGLESFFLTTISMLHFIMNSRRINNIMGSNWLDIYDLDRYSLMIIVLKKEMKLIFVYVYIAFLYTWLQLANSNYTVTYFNFLRWLIEASLCPLILIFTLISFQSMEDFFDLYHTFYVPTIINKVPLFILMRFAEIQSDLYVNTLQILFFKVYCYWRWK